MIDKSNILQHFNAVLSDPGAYKHFVLVNLMFTQLCCRVITGSSGSATADSGVFLLNIVLLRSLQSTQTHEIVVVVSVGYLVNASYVAVPNYICFTVERPCTDMLPEKVSSKCFQRRFSFNLVSVHVDEDLIFLLVRWGFATDT